MSIRENIKIKKPAPKPPTLHIIRASALPSGRSRRYLNQELPRGQARSRRRCREDIE